MSPDITSDHGLGVDSTVSRWAGRQTGRGSRGSLGFQRHLISEREEVGYADTTAGKNLARTGILSPRIRQGLVLLRWISTPHQLYMHVRTVIEVGS